MEAHAAPRPPSSLAELTARAASLSGATLGELAARLAFFIPQDPLRAKGKLGQLVELALGATGGSAAVHDFPDLGVELKTIPISRARRPRESTYVCTLDLANADRAEWETSWVRAKLAHVLWVPIVTEPDVPIAERPIAAPIFWRPSGDEEADLRADFDDVMGAIGIGGIESVTARMGTWLQVRPKAADGTPRAIAYGAEGERIATVPRGFYLRTSFTAAILARGA